MQDRVYLSYLVTYPSSYSSSTLCVSLFFAVLTIYLLYCSCNKAVLFLGTFDVVVVNLYPFYDKVSSTGGIEFEDGIENIDIGGPTMIRVATKVIFS